MSYTLTQQLHGPSDHRQETLRVDDRIVAVNGVKGDVAQMAKQLVAKSLTLEVCSY